MKILITLFLMITLCSLGLNAQERTPKDRIAAAYMSEEYFRKYSLEIRFYTRGYEERSLVVYGPYTNKQNEVVAVIKLLTEDGINFLFDVDGFEFICFEGIDRCFDKEELLLILDRL